MSKFVSSNSETVGEGETKVPRGQNRADARLFNSETIQWRGYFPILGNVLYTEVGFQLCLKVSHKVHRKYPSVSSGALYYRARFVF